MSAEAIKNLRECQKQLDADGTMVGVSRQALDETLASHADLLEALKEALPFVQDATLESVVIDNGPHLTRADLARMCAAVIAKATGE